MKQPGQFSLNERQEEGYTSFAPPTGKAGMDFKEAGIPEGDVWFFN